MPQDIRYQNDQIIKYIYHSIVVLSSIFITYLVWSSNFKNENFITVTWNIAVPYILVFCSSVLVIISSFGQFQLMILMLNILTLVILFKWQVVISTLSLGIFISIIFCSKFININGAGKNFEVLEFKIIYLLIFISSILVAFLKPKQERQEAVESQNEDLTSQVQLQSHELRNALGLKEQFIRNVEHEYHAPMTGILSMAQVLDDSYDKFTDEQRKDAIKTIFHSAIRLGNFDDNIRSLAKLNKMDYSLSMVLVNLSELVYERVKRCRKLYGENKESREFILNIEDNLTVRGDKQYIIQLLDNLIINAISYCKAGKIKISLRNVPGSVPEDTTDSKDTREDDKVEFTITDEGIGIPENELQEIFGIFNVSSRTSSIAGGRGVGLALCKRVAELHGGEISARNNQNSPGASFIFTLPKAV